MSTEITRYDSSPIESRWDYARRMAGAGELLPKGLSGSYKDPESGMMKQGIIPAKVFLILETGAMLGVNPMAALQGINVIEGSASIAPSLMTALIRRAGHKIRVDVTGSIAGGDIAATAKLTRSDEPDEPYTVTWTIDDAIAAGLVDSYLPDGDGVFHVRARSEKDNAKPWETYTRAMLKWRAIGEVARDGAEDVLMGVHYGPDELGSIVNEDGGVEPETFADLTEREDRAIARIKATTDKADMQSVFQWISEENDSWTDRVRAEFASHMMTLTVDTRPARPGAPGQTGDPEFDGPTETPAATAEPGRPDVVSAPASERPSETPKAATGRTAPITETEEERYERESAEEFARAKASEEAAAAFGDIEDAVVVDDDSTEGTLFDAGPLGGKS